MDEVEITKMEEQKINFLNGAIADAQELIRFIDTKTAIVVTIIGAYLIGTFSIFDKIVAYCDKFSNLFWIIFLIFAILLIFSIVLTTKIINPTNNPNENIKLGGATMPKIPFYLSQNEYKYRWKIFVKNDVSFKLAQNFKSYKEKFKDINAIDIIDSLNFELLKVSYIRNIKNDRFNALIKVLILTTILFFGFYIIYSHELFLIENKLQTIKENCCEK